MQRIEKTIEHLPHFIPSSQITKYGICGSMPFNNTPSNSVVPTNTLYVTNQACSCALNTTRRSGFIDTITGYAAPSVIITEGGHYKKVYYCS